MPVFTKNRRRVALNSHIYGFDYRNPCNDIYTLNKVHAEDMCSVFRCIDDTEEKINRHVKKLFELNGLKLATEKQNH